MTLHKTFKDLFREIVASNSISSASPQLDQGNLDVINLLANYLTDLGFNCEQMQVAENKANLIATYGTGTGGLVLAGHTDTVPCNEQLWKSDPFVLSERDNRWYGLGSCDMKGFFPLAIEAAKHHLDKQFQQPLIILATADEESSMAGARALVEAGVPKARHAVVGEPTGMRPVSLHKGIMVEQLVIRGRSGHSSDPSLGINAMESMQRILAQLMILRDQMQQHRHPGFTIDYPTLNLGCIKGGDNANRICGDCSLAFEIRPLPGMDMDQLQKDIEHHIERIALADKVQWTLEKLLVPPFCAEDHSEIVSLCEKLTGHHRESVAFATEAPYLQQLGMDVVVLGPGDIEVAHQPDEYLSMDRIKPTIDFLSQLIGHCCLMGKHNIIAP
jgi:acetylornithine deacetylase